MRYLVDTRLDAADRSQTSPPQPARTAIDRLQEGGVRLLVAPQNLIEFWADGEVLIGQARPRPVTRRKSARSRSR